MIYGLPCLEILICCQEFLFQPCGKKPKTFTKQHIESKVSINLLPRVPVSAMLKNPKTFTKQHTESKV